MAAFSLLRGLRGLKGLRGSFFLRAAEVRVRFLITFALLFPKSTVGMQERVNINYARLLSPDELEAAQRLVESVKKGVEDVRRAVAEGRPTGRPAEELLAELLEEESTKITYTKPEKAKK